MKNIEALTRKITDMPDVMDVHLCLVANNNIASSTHILANDQTLSEFEATKKRIEEMLRVNGVDHSTLQIKCSRKNCDNNLYCQINHYESGNGHNH